MLSDGYGAVLASAAMSAIAMVKDFDVSMSTLYVLEAESFAEVSAASNAVIA